MAARFVVQASGAMFDTRRMTTVPITYLGQSH